MIVHYDNGELKVTRNENCRAMGYLVPILEGFEAVVKCPEMWAEALKARAVYQLIASEWVLVEIGTSYSRDTAYCISVYLVKEWLREQIVVHKTEQKYYEKRLKELELE